MRKLKLGTLFSGIGAIEQALLRLGIDYQIEFACDNGEIPIDVDTECELKKIRNLPSPSEKNRYVRNIYKQQSRKTNFIEPSYLANYDLDQDKFFYDVKMFDGFDYTNKIDLLVGGSPCQSFSIAGARGGFDDTRGTLFFEIARIAAVKKPKYLFLENVPGLLNHDSGKTFETILHTLDELGYDVCWQVLNSKNFGVPQSRNRVFIIGYLRGQCAGEVLSFKQTSGKALVQRKPYTR